MSSHAVRIEHVVFDPAAGRYAANLALPGAAARPLHVSVPGHRAWDFGRIAAALVDAAEHRGGHHARA